MKKLRPAYSMASSPGSRTNSITWGVLILIQSEQRHKDCATGMVPQVGQGVISGQALHTDYICNVETNHCYTFETVECCSCDSIHVIGTYVPRGPDSFAHCFCAQGCVSRASWVTPEPQKAPGQNPRLAPDGSSQ